MLNRLVTSPDWVPDGTALGRCTRKWPRRPAPEGWSGATLGPQLAGKRRNARHHRRMFSVRAGTSDRSGMVRVYFPLRGWDRREARIAAAISVTPARMAASGVWA
jgi:hypothetical protein